MKILTSSSQEELNQLAKIAFGFDSFYFNIKHWHKNNLIIKISIYFINEKPVGAAIVKRGTFDQKEHDVEIFVKRNFRRKGIGTKLINSLNINFFHCCSYGSNGQAYKFFNTISTKKKMW